MTIFKIIYGIAFAGSIGCLFTAYHYFQYGNNTNALLYLIIGVVTGIVNFKALAEE